MNLVEIEVTHPESVLGLYVYMLFDFRSQTDACTCDTSCAIIFAFFCRSDKLQRKWGSVAVVLVLTLFCFITSNKSKQRIIV